MKEIETKNNWLEEETERRRAVLAKFLEVELDDIDSDAIDTFSEGRTEYRVYTDEEADEAVKEAIQQSLWAFNAEFIASHTKNGLSSAAIKALRQMQGELCEDANDIVEALIEDLDAFIEDAVASDGRGHFLSSYDGEENEMQDAETKEFYYIYKN